MTVFSDLLCVWAYVAQIRIDEARAEFGAQLKIVPRCCSVFGDTATKVGVVDADLADTYTRALRNAFFVECRDIGCSAVQRDVLQRVGGDVEAVRAALDDGFAHATLAADLAAAESARIQGSPTFVLNEGRQILYGSVGYRVLQANIRELLRVPDAENASWC